MLTEGGLCLVSAKPDMMRSFELPSTRDFRWNINNNKHVVFVGVRPWLTWNCFTYGNLFSPHNSPSVVGLGLRLLYRGGSRETERLNNLPKVTYLTSNELGLRSKQSHYVMLSPMSAVQELLLHPTLLAQTEVIVTQPHDFLDLEEEPPYHTWISQPPVLLVHEVLPLWCCCREGNVSWYQLNLVFIIMAIVQKLILSPILVSHSQPGPRVWGQMKLDSKVAKWDGQDPSGQAECDLGAHVPQVHRRRGFRTVSTHSLENSLLHEWSTPQMFLWSFSKYKSLGRLFFEMVWLPALGLGHRHFNLIFNIFWCCQWNAHLIFITANPFPDDALGRGVTAP